MTGTGADWFGPGNPMRPSAPSEVTGRRFDYPVAANLQQRPRAYEAINFETLKALSRSYDLLRLVIETRKDQLAQLDWNIGLTDKKAKLSDDQKSRALAISNFFKMPDRVHDWDTWLRLILEDLFVLDAPTLYRRRTRGGDLYGYKPLHGGDFKLIIDDWGDLPLPPHPAFQQVLKGLGAVNYSSDQIIYRPRNPMTDKVYGFGPVEQIIAIVNIGLRRETWQISFFTEGNLPDALIGTPNEWTPDQIRNFQDWFDARLQGNIGNRRGATFVPGDVAKGVVNTKDTELFGAAEEWLARVVCFAFSVSPQPFVKMMNRATAGTSQEVSLLEGLEPIKKWVKSLIDYLIRTDFNSPDLVFCWTETTEVDPKVASDITDQKLKSGRITLNEARDTDGLDPYGAEVPEAAMPLIITATGAVPVGMDAQIDAAKKKQDALGPPEGAAAAPGATPPPGGNRRGPGPSDKGGGTGGAAGSGSAKVHSHRADSASLAKALSVSVDRPLARRTRKAIAKALAPILAAAGDDVAAQVSKVLRASKVAKADQDGSDGPVQPDVDAIVAGLDLSSLDAIPDAIEEDLFDLASDTMLKALAQVGARASSDLVNQINERALAFAKERAAELVGKRWTAAGDLIDNPNAKWAITQATRDMLRTTISDGLANNIGTPAIADEIQANYAFSTERASMIATTEVSNANEQSKLDGWRSAGDVGVVVRKSWEAEADCCEDCALNEEDGIIDLDDDFSSGDDAAPAHPNCRCVTIPEVEASQDEGGDNADGE